MGRRSHGVHVRHVGGPKRSRYSLVLPNRAVACNTAGAVYSLLCPPHTPMQNLSPVAASVVMTGRGDSMTSFRPTKIEQLAIEAKLNLIFGAKVYDSLFLGFEVMEVAKDELRAWAPSEHRAAVIEVRYSGTVAWIAQTVFNRPIRQVTVLLRGMKHDVCEQPAF